MDKSIIRLVYYYAICLITLLVILWGIVDATSALISYSLDTRFKNSISIQKNGASSIDDFFQKKIVVERLADGILRILIPGSVFLYYSLKIKKFEEK